MAPVDPKKGKLLYHITSIKNLEEIFKNGLKARSDIKEFNDIADAEILTHREKHDLNKFVPLHFMCGSPFAGIVQDQFQDIDFAYITVSRIFAQKNAFKVLPKHPLSLESSVPLEFEEGMELIDWKTMAKREYGDHDCKMICMAECLSEETIIASSFNSVICKAKDEEKLQGIANEIFNGNIPFYINVIEGCFKS